MVFFVCIDIVNGVYFYIRFIFYVDVSFGDDKCYGCFFVFVF